VIVGVEGENIMTGQFLGHLGDVPDPKACVDQSSGGVTFDQKAVNMHRLTNEENSRF
jgi:hypothetical protein